MGTDTKARLEIDRHAARPVVQLVVPPGTKLMDAAKLAENISQQVIAKIAPVGCGACISGVDFHIREDLGELINVSVDVANVRLVGTEQLVGAKG